MKENREDMLLVTRQRLEQRGKLAQGEDLSAAADLLVDKSKVRWTAGVRCCAVGSCTVL
jgi:hypothetical protein